MINWEASWRELIGHEMERCGESWGEVEACTITDVELDRRFDSGFGGTEGSPFTLWTKRRVYFPVVYDGAEWVASVPRNPTLEHTEHVGGQ